MSAKRYDTNPEKQLILEGLEFFESSENQDMVNPEEIKILMEKLELKDKMSFIYDLISELCSSRQVCSNRGVISKSDFISFLEKKLSDAETKEGIHSIYNVFTDSNENALPMTNFCRTAREIGDMEKDEELKQLLKEADMTGKEINFDEFHDIMTKDDNNKIKKDDKKYQKQNINRFARKKLWKREEKEDSEQNDKVNNINSNKIKEEIEPQNSYSYRRVKIEQTKKVSSPKNDKQNEVKVEKEVKEEPVVEKLVTVEEIIQEKKVEEPINNNHVRYKYKFRNRFRREPKEEVVKEDVNNTEKKEENNEENNVNNNDNSESKRYHRRYRPNYSNNEPKTENNNNNITYNRYRRKAEN